MIWRFQGFADFASQTLLPVWTGAILLGLVVVLYGKRRAAAELPGTPRRAAFLLYGIGASAFLFSAATVLGVPDIRFVPPALIISVFVLGLFLRFAIPEALVLWRGRGGLSLRLLPALVALTLVASSIGAMLMSHNTPAWFRWNYSGYEAKVQWRNLERMAATYRGDMTGGRFLWEKQNQNDNADFGSERGFENIWRFFGRPSSEGIHYGSSFMARATTYLQSCYSLDPVDPEAERLYSTVDPGSWALRFTQANARHIVVYSEEIRKRFSERPEFRIDKAFGKFSVFEYLGFPSSYVEVLDPENISIVNDSAGGFRTDFYRFFRDYELVRRPFVPSSFADDELSSRVAVLHNSYDGLLARYGSSEE